MSKQYCCDFDNSVFNTEEELIQHIKEKHVKVFEQKDHEVSDLLSKLQNDFPDYKISIKNGKGTFAQYVINLSKDDFMIEQCYGYFQTYKELISEIRNKIDTYQFIVNELTNKYDFEEFKFKGFRYGYGDNIYDFEFKLKGDDDYIEEHYCSYDTTIDDFIKQFDKYFVKILEGKPDRYYYGGYFEDYTIDGTQIDYLLSKAKKVRLEVLE